MDENKYTKIIDKMSELGNTYTAMTFLVKQICLINDWSYAEIWCPDIKGNFLNWVGYWGRSDEHSDKFSKYSSYFKFAKGIGLIGRTWQESKPIINNDINNNKEFLRSDVAIKSKFNGAISIPIIKNNTTLSIICFFFEQITERERDEIKNLFTYLNACGDKKLP